MDTAAVQQIFSAKSYHAAEQAVLVSNQPLTAAAQQVAQVLGVAVRQVDSRSWSRQGAAIDVPAAPLTAAAEVAAGDSTQALAPTASPTRRADAWQRLTAVAGLALVGILGWHFAAGRLSGQPGTTTSASGGGGSGVLVQSPPGASTNLQVVDGSDAVQLSWSPVTGAASYEVWRKQNGSAAEVGTPAGNSFPGGYVVTNNHVVENATYYINVTLQNDGNGSSYKGQVFHAHVVATDPGDDLALLELDNGWSGNPLPLGESSYLYVGEPVAALGHPGLEQLTMTTGSIGALNQSVNVQGYGTMDNMIAYNAGVVGGSSGSPVLDHWGNVVGVEEATGTSNGNYDWAVPVDALRALLEANGVALTN